jgi:hypothetical protein
VGTGFLLAAGQANDKAERAGSYRDYEADRIQAETRLRTGRLLLLGGVILGAGAAGRYLWLGWSPGGGRRGWRWGDIFEGHVADRAGIVAGAVACVLSCLPRGRFHCADDNQCVSAEGRGVCEAEGVCSFPDARCPLGRRYARFAAGESSSDGGNCVQPHPCTGTPVVELRAGGGHACLRRLDNRVHCWGRNAEGQLGDGTLRPRAVPTPVAGLTGCGRWPWVKRTPAS